MSSVSITSESTCAQREETCQQLSGLQMLFQSSTNHTFSSHHMCLSNQKSMKTS